MSDDDRIVALVADIASIRGKNECLERLHEFMVSATDALTSTVMELQRHNARIESALRDVIHLLQSGTYTWSDPLIATALAALNGDGE